MSRIVAIGLLTVVNLLIFVSILVFASGFFPYKPFLPGRNDFQGALHVEPPFDKLIFMVVDALRSDFVYSNGSGFTFVQSLIRRGAALPFTAHAASPTITMPRVKAITTGSIPSFVDVILNFAESDTTSTLTSQDTWLEQLRSKPGGSLVMYGDDTWLKLFPDTFTRVDGTSSFFVSDFTEVDYNVTRHVSQELDQTDWNGLLMHYLGLDHIGHKSGPRSPHMIPKQIEMDGIVKQIYSAMETKGHLASALLVLCGDHGMNDAGNHGGSTPGETSPALVFISPTFQESFAGLPCPAKKPESEFQYYSVVAQSDIAPSLAGLLGFPVPLNNLGVFIPELLKLWRKDSDKLALLQQNAKQISKIVEATFGQATFDEDRIPENCTSPSSDIEKLQCYHATINAGRTQDGDMERDLLQYLRHAQSIMSGAASNYDLLKLKSGIGLAAVATVIAVVVFTVNCTTRSVGILPFSIWSGLAYGSMMFASSFVEEEQHFWYWITGGWLVRMYATKFSQDDRRSREAPWLIGTVLALSRIMRRWNQTGQKHAGEADIAKTLLPTYPAVLWTLVVAVFLELARRIALHGYPRAPRQVSTIAAISVCLAAFIYRVAFTSADAPELLEGLGLFQHYRLSPLKVTNLVHQARAVFIGIGMSAAYGLFHRFRATRSRAFRLRLAWSLHDLLTLFLVTQSRVNNIPTFLIFGLQLKLLEGLELDPDQITVTSIIFQHASFFAFGGSNAISSIDLSNAYNGIDGYNVTAVGALTFVSNWIGPIWWATASSLLLAQRCNGNRQALLRHLGLITLFAASSLSSVMVACTMLRTHLFIWTVFSPKYLYSMAWSLGQHLFVSTLLGSFLYEVGS